MYLELEFILLVKYHEKRKYMKYFLVIVILIRTRAITFIPHYYVL
jgi:hypothetical protein